MITSLRVIRLLLGGQYQSLTEIADKLEIGRTTAHRHILELRSEGIEVLEQAEERGRKAYRITHKAVMNYLKNV